MYYSVFFRDTQILIENNNEHLVHYLDAGVSENAPYLVMEYIEGVTLKYMLDEFNRHTMECRVDWFRQVVSGLSRVHELGLLHRDLKSSNVLVREDGTAVLLDFGVEYQLLLGAGFLNDNEIYCTPFYVSPERMIGEPATVQSDLYALGILLYEILIGDKPYLGKHLADILQQHMFAETPKLPENLQIYQPLLSSLLAKSPEGRKSSAAEVLSWLDEHIQ